MSFIAENTDIPVPRLFASYQDDQAVYLVMEYIDGVSMAELSSEDRAIVEAEIAQHLETMRRLKSKTWGGPTNIVSLTTFICLNLFGVDMRR